MLGEEKLTNFFARECKIMLILSRLGSEHTLKQQLASIPTPVGPGLTPRRGAITVAIKSEAEKDYHRWHRGGRRTKDNFPILNSNKGYIVWQPKVRAELEHQGLTDFSLMRIRILLILSLNLLSGNFNKKTSNLICGQC